MDPKHPDLFDCLKEARNKFGTREAYKLSAESSYIDYNEAFERLQAVATHLRPYVGEPIKAVKPRQARIGILLNNCPAFLNCFWSAAALRAVATALNNRLSSKEIQDLLEGCPCEAMFIGVEFMEVVRDIPLASMGVKAVVWVGQWATSVEAQAIAEQGMTIDGVENLRYGNISSPTDDARKFLAMPLPNDDEMQGVQLFFTSGTTGKPKQIVHSAKNIYYWAVFSLSTLGLYADDKHCALHSMTMSHIADNAFVWSLTFIGGRHAFMTCSMGDVGGFLQTLSDESVTIAKAAPTLISIACGFSAKAFAKYDLSEIRWIWSAGAALADDLRTRAEERFGCDIWRGYGMTESTGPVSCSRGGALGYRPLEGVQIRIMKEDGTIAAQGESGEIQVKGPTVFAGYSGVPPETNVEAFVDGWFKSGDAGKFDEHGMLFITGRLKDMIIVAGENVFAAEVEAVISKIEAVKVVAVIGKPDKTLGEVVEAAIIAQEGQNVTEADVIQFCKEKLADFKVPKRVHFVKEMPMTASGKVQKSELKAQLYAKETDANKPAATSDEKAQNHENVETMLQSVIRDSFGLDLDLNDELFESGLTSLQAIELLSLAEELLGCELPGSLLFECVTIAEIANFLREEGLVKRFDEGISSGALQGLSRVLSRQFTKITSGIMRLRHVHYRSADEYVALDQDTYDTIEAKARMKARNQNSPLVLLMQAVLLVLTRPIICTVGFAPIILLFTLLDQKWPLSYQFLVAAPVIIASSFMMFFTLAALKWILLGKIKPGVYPLWGWYYCRWLAIHNSSRWVFRFLAIYRSTPFYAFFYRLMGTKIGANAVIDTCWIMDNDLVTIGEKSYIARDVNIQPSYVTNGVLTLKKIFIGDETAIRHGACILGGANIFDRATVGHLQTVHTTIIPKNQGDGTGELPIPAEVKQTSSYHNRVPYFFLQCAGIVYLAYIFAVCVIIAGAILYQVFKAARINEGLPSTNSITVLVDPAYYWPLFYMTLCVPLALWCILPWTYFLCIFLTKWIFIGQLPAMVMLTEKPLIMDVWKRWLLIRMTDWWWFQILLAITTMGELSCTIYRLLGAKVGKRVYFNAPYVGADFDLLEVEDDCMIAWDVSVLANCATGLSRPVHFRKGACVANNLVLPDGITAGENCLVGDLVSAPSGHTFTAGTVWTGKGRPICVGKTTHPPPQTNMFKYWMYETLLCTMQVFLPIIMNMPGVVTLIFVKKGVNIGIKDHGDVSDTARVLIIFLPLFPLIILVLMICKLLTMIVAKWLLLGKFKPGPTPKFMAWKYVSWVALDAIIFAIEMSWLNDMRGTAFACWWLRALGAKVGKNVCQLGVVGGIETDLKSIGDHACLNFNAKPLSHSLEYHMLTFGRCTIEEGATVGCRSIVEMDAVVPAWSSVPSMTPVHAVKVSSISFKNLNMSKNAIQRSYTTRMESIQEEKVKYEEKDVEKGSDSRSDSEQDAADRVVTNQTYFVA